MMMLRYEYNLKRVTSFVLAIVIGIIMGHFVAAYAQSQTIEPGNIIKLEISPDDGLSGHYTVDSKTGEIYLELLGYVMASGLTPQQLSQDLEAGLKKYYRNPRVKARIVSRPGMAGPSEEPALGMHVYIMGPVINPGEYILPPGTSLLQLIAKAGGPIYRPRLDALGNPVEDAANLNKVSVFRNNGNKTEAIEVNCVALLKEQDITQNVILQEGDTVFIPSYTASQFQVLGEVAHPGSYALSSGEKINLFNALTRAGGLNTHAAWRSIKVVRTTGPTPETFVVDLGEILKKGRLELMPTVMAGDVIYVHESSFQTWRDFMDILWDLSDISYIGQDLKAWEYYGSHVVLGGSRYTSGGVTRGR